MKDVRSLYRTVIKKICMKHHFGMLPINFSLNIMPDFNVSQLENKISRISLEHMYDYKKGTNLLSTQFKKNCIDIWNSLQFDIKALPYMS